MIARLQKSMQEKEKGFTLIELLVVVIIIGILAAIAIPMYLRQRERAWESAVTSDLRNAAVAAESYATVNDGVYTGLTPELLAEHGFNESAPVDVTVTVPTGGLTYELQGEHENLTGTWTYDSESGTITGPGGGGADD